MARSLRLTWTKEEFASIYMEAVSAVKRDFDVYVESRDGTTDPVYVYDNLKNWGVLAEGAKIPMISDVEIVPALLADEDYFPHYDTIWATRRGNRQIALPPFMTWYAANAVGAKPFLPYGTKYVHEYDDWQIVEDWMRENGIMFGVSQAYLNLLVEYNDTQCASKSDSEAIIGLNGWELRLTWSDDAVASVYSQAAATYGHDFDLYVDSLDATIERHQLRALFDIWEQIADDFEPDVVTFAQNRVLTSDVRRRVMAGNYTVWAAKRKSRAIVQPSFSVFSAAKSVGRTPDCIDRRFCLSDWHVVKDWMAENDILFGISQCKFCLLIER